MHRHGGTGARRRHYHKPIRSRREGQLHEEAVDLHARSRRFSHDDSVIVLLGNWSDARQRSPPIAPWALSCGAVQETCVKFSRTRAQHLGRRCPYFSVGAVAHFRAIMGISSHKMGSRLVTRMMRPQPVNASLEPWDRAARGPGS